MLLIIFMVMTPLIQAGVKVDLPRTAKSRPMPGQDDQLVLTALTDVGYTRIGLVTEKKRS